MKLASVPDDVDVVRRSPAARAGSRSGIVLESGGVDSATCGAVGTEGCVIRAILSGRRVPRAGWDSDAGRLLFRAEASELLRSPITVAFFSTGMTAIRVSIVVRRRASVTDLRLAKVARSFGRSRRLALLVGLMVSVRVSWAKASALPSARRKARMLPAIGALVRLKVPSLPRPWSVGRSWS